MKVNLSEWNDTQINLYITENGRNPAKIKEHFILYFQALYVSEDYDALSLACKLFLEQWEKAKEGNDKIK